MKNQISFLFFLIFLLQNVISSAQENIIPKDTFQSESDSLSAKWFKKHELGYSKIIRTRYNWDYDHRFEYRYNLGRNAIRGSMAFYKFYAFRNLEISYVLNPDQNKVINNQEFYVETNNIMIGYEFRNRFMDRICLFYGLQGGYQWSDFDIKTRYKIIQKEQGRQVSSQKVYDDIKVKEKAFILCPFVGLRLEVLKNLAIGTELNLDVNISNFKGEMITFWPSYQEHKKINAYYTWFDNPGMFLGRYFLIVKF